MDNPTARCHLPDMAAAGRPITRRDRSAPTPGLGVLLIVLLLGSLGSAVTGRAAAAPRGPVWQVFAIRYATLPAFPVRALVAGADSTRTLDIAAMFWLLEGPKGRRVLVDAGFYRQPFLDAWKPADYVRPSEALRRFGVPPDSISDVILTHVHWDHVDGADLFPDARVWVQRQEYEYYVGEDGTAAHEGIDSVDAAMLAGLAIRGRVQFIDGDSREIIPGITAYVGGRHTFASQFLGVRTAKGTVVLASDNIYLYENLSRHLPIAQTLDPQSNLAAQQRMKRIASAERLIVPGHDPAVFERFPSAGPGVVKIE